MNELLFGESFAEAAFGHGFNEVNTFGKGIALLVAAIPGFKKTVVFTYRVSPAIEDLYLQALKIVVIYAVNCVGRIVVGRENIRQFETNSQQGIFVAGCDGDIVKVIIKLVLGRRN